MRYLNLTEGFNPYKSDSSNTVEYNYFVFSGGEPHIKITSKYPQGDPIDVMVTIRIQSFNDVGKLFVAMEALSQIGWLGHKMLFLPYFPGARQDLRNKGEALTSLVYAQLINDLEFDNVEILDPHSPTITALIKNVDVIDSHKFVLTALRSIYPKYDAATPLLISPDAGANKKIKDLAVYLSEFNKVDIVKCDKTRNTSTGELSGFEVYADKLNGRDCVIPDDICDGGGTFVGLAKELKKKGAGDLYLLVTHGIFSKGFTELRKYYRGIYTTSSWRSSISMETPEIERGSEIVTILPCR